MEGIDIFTGATHEQYAAEFCLRAAYKKLKEGDVETALKRVEEATRSLKALQEASYESR